MRMRNFASMEMATSKRGSLSLHLRKNRKSQHRVVEIFELPKSTIRDIWKDREKISCHLFGVEDPTVAKWQCIVHGSQFRLLDDALTVWFLPSEIRIFHSYR